MSPPWATRRASASGPTRVDAPRGAAARSLSVADTSGKEDTAIALSISSALSEVDPDAVLSIKVSGVPAGVTLNHGTNNHDGSYTLPPTDLSGLSLTSDGETQHFDLSVVATATDGGSLTTTASTAGSIHVDVTPVADAPSPSVADTSGKEETAIALSIGSAPSEVDPDAVLSIKVSGVPAGVTLNHGTNNHDGSYTLAPTDLSGLSLTSDGETPHLDLSVVATATDGGSLTTTASTAGSIHVDVTPGAG